MFRIFEHHISKWALIQIFADGLFCFTGVLLAFAHIDTAALTDIPSANPSQVVFTAACFVFVMLFLCLAMGSYRRVATGASLRVSIGRPFVAAAFGWTIFFFALKIVGGPEYTIQLLGIAVVYMITGVMVVRGSVWLASKYAIGAPRVLIVGAGVEAQAVASDLRNTQYNQYTIVGFYDIDTKSLSQPGLKPTFSATTPIQSIVSQHNIDEVIVAVGERRGGVPIENLLACRIMGVRILDMAGFYERTHREVPTHSLRASWLVYGNGFSQGIARKTAKRLFDVIASSILIALASPVMMLTAVAIRIEGFGPIIYRQTRVGLGGREFICLKFRSMRTDAERDGVAVWATENDPRLTRIGRFIRATRIDELPQLFTVLRGQMSMVGPRPERPCFVEELERIIPFYKIRHCVKPGLTGWAQIRYRYGSSIADAERKHRFDLYYIKNGSLFLDLLILIETVSVVLFREGAH